MHRFVTSRRKESWQHSGALGDNVRKWIHGIFINWSTWDIEAHWLEDTHHSIVLVDGAPKRHDVKAYTLRHFVTRDRLSEAGRKAKYGLSQKSRVKREKTLLACITLHSTAKPAPVRWCYFSGTCLSMSHRYVWQASIAASRFNDSVPIMVT